MTAAQPHQAPSEADVAAGFRDAMGQLATGVVMVTCYVDGKPWGLTVSACCSVSVSPPLLLVSLSEQTASAHAIAEDGRFGVSILGEALIDVARFGSAKGQPKWVAEFCRDEIRGAAWATPAVARAIAHIDCTVEQSMQAGDHVIFVGSVRDVIAHPGDLPLVYHARGYHRLGASTDLGVGPIVDETIDSLLYDYPMPRAFSRIDSDLARVAAPAVNAG